MGFGKKNLKTLWNTGLLQRFIHQEQQQSVDSRKSEDRRLFLQSVSFAFLLTPFLLNYFTTSTTFHYNAAWCKAALFDPLTISFMKDYPP